VSAFFDTNILIYAQQTGDKAERARVLLAAGGKISVQVLNEFTSVSLRKLSKHWAEIDEAIDDLLEMLDPPEPLTHDLHTAARALAELHRLAFYDALIVTAAIEAGCDTLYSEDMQHGRVFGGLTIRDPFLNDAL
jgi:predicted nucleic acid-binding protein